MGNERLTGSSVLILEDDLLLRRQLAAALEKLGADVIQASDLQGARRLAAELTVDLVLMDLHLSDGLSLELLKEKCFSGNTGVIVMTAHSAVTTAVEAMRLGALDFLVKPFNPAELPLVIERARRAGRSARREEHRRAQTGVTEFFFGSSLAALEGQLAKILASDRRMEGVPAPVLIQGETGTGKTTIARWIHQTGPRAAQPLVEVNCSALPETLAESELFGHERGAFTDARTTRLGLFEAAHGGTLFLDELPSLPLSLQAKVLTVIEDHRIRRVGGSKPIEVDVRLVAAASRDLKELVAAGQFREDLVHRLDLFRLHLPPLRERGQDMLKLAEQLLERLCRRHRCARRLISEQGQRRLLAYSWPGNIRELAHELERAVVFEEGQALEFNHLPVTCEPANYSVKSPHDWFNEAFVFPEQGFSLEEAMLRLIGHALKQTANNISATARLLGVPRHYLRYRLEGKREIPPPEKE